MIQLLRVLIVVSLFAGLSNRASQAAEPPVLLDQRAIELPGIRLLSLSPDGEQLAAAASDLGQLCLYDSLTLAETRCIDLTPLEAGLRVEDVVWSPDSTMLVLAEQPFVRYRDGDLWLIDAATGTLTNLTDDGANGSIPLMEAEKVDYKNLFLDVAPAWLPDSSAITFSRSTWIEGTWFGNTLQTIPVTGGEPALLTTVSIDVPGVVYYGMRWTADASRLFYSVFYPDADNPDNGIWAIAADGSDPTQLLGSDPDFGPPIIAGLSPGGERVLAYYPSAAAQFNLPEKPLYAIVETATGVVTPIELLDETAPDTAFARLVVLSPDGTTVLYASRLTDPDFLIFTRTITDSTETLLVPDGLPGAASISITASVSWTNDGQILLLSAPDKATILHIDGGADLTPPPIATPQPPAAAEASPTNATYEIGATVVTNDNDIPLRSAPGTDAQTVATLSLGTNLIILAAPVDAGGHTWLPVTDPATGTIGYIRTEFIDIPD